MEAFYSWAFRTKPPYKLFAEIVFVFHLLWTWMSLFQIFFLLYWGLGYAPYFFLYILINILAPLPWKACPMTKLEKYLRAKTGDTLDSNLTFNQRLFKRWFGFTPKLWYVHIAHGSCYAISLLIIIYKYFQ